MRLEIQFLSLRLSLGTPSLRRYYLRDHFVQSLAPALIPQPNSTRPLQLLDVAGGTGDIAFRLLRLAHTLHPSHGPDTLRLTMSDINPSMLSVGQSRAESQLSPTLQSHLSFLVADAQDLPRDVLPDNSVDLYTVAFGIRNFTDIRKGLAEAFRVLRPGGVFACLEFGKVTGPGSTYDSSAESLSSGLPFSGFLSTPPHRTLFDAVYKRWSFSAIPLIGQIVAGDRDSYQYLVESIERFPAQREFRDMIAEAGFDIPGDPGWEDLTAGVAAIHKGVKPLHA